MTIMPLHKDYDESVLAAINYAYHRPVLHVLITDGNGETIADVDAKSTYDGLAYYLSARGVIPGATEQSVRMEVGTYRSDTDEIVFVQRGAVFGEMRFQCKARVH